MKTRTELMNFDGTINIPLETEINVICGRKPDNQSFKIDNIILEKIGDKILYTTVDSSVVSKEDIIKRVQEDEAIFIMRDTLENIYNYQLVHTDGITITGISPFSPFAEREN